MLSKLNISENHFEAVQDNQNFAKLYYIVLSFLVIIFASPLYYGIIWYERFGHDNRQTLVNQLFSFFCMVILVYILVVIPGDICTAFITKIPSCYCDIQNLFKNVSVVVLLLIVDTILVVKFVLIFYLKNPSIAHDDFWNLFVKIWIIAFVFISQFVQFFFTERKSLYYYICIKDFPASDSKLHLKIRWLTIALVVFSIILCSVIYIKVKLFMKKGETTTAQNSTKMISLEKNMPKSKTAALIVILSMLLMLLFLFGMRKMEPGNMNDFPNYYIYWILHSVPQILISFFLVILYHGKGPMKKVLIREAKDILLNYELTKDWITVQT